VLTIVKAKLATVLISAVAVTAVAGTSVAAATHAGPFAAGAVFGPTTSTASHHQPTHTPDNHQHFAAQGQISGVTFATGNTSGTLLFLPNGTTTAVVVKFTAQTHVEVSVTHSTSSTTHGNPGAAGLKAGLYANIVGDRQTDGTILASTIQASDNGKAHQGGAPPTPGPGHHDPTPDPGNGHQPTPGPGNGHQPTPGPSH
jgi:hypothetical protein